MSSDKYNALGLPIPGLGRGTLPNEQVGSQQEAASFQRALSQPEQPGPDTTSTPAPTARAPLVQPLVQPPVQATRPRPSAPDFALWNDKPENQRLVDSEYRSFT